MLRVERPLRLAPGEIPFGSIAFIRDPIDRLVSAYRFFANMGQNRFFGSEWPDMVDRVLGGLWDPHVLPQSLFIRKAGARAYLFEDLAAIWPYKELRRENISQGAYMFPYRMDELLEHYKEDRDLRWQLKATSRRVQ